MNWGDQVFRYCERAQDASFWAEPFNAASNVGFLVVAALGARRLVQIEAGASPDRGQRTLMQACLVALVALIGVGSFLFHTFATRWARLADVAPIGLFMVVYLVFALRSFLEWSWGHVALAMALFIGVNEVTAAITCPTRLVGVTQYVREPCLNGTMSYAPALATLLLVGALVHRRHPAGRRLLIAAGLFLAAMVLRWIDAKVCPWTSVFGRPRGTHALWHAINAVTMYVLLMAAIDGRGASTRRGRA